MLYKKVIIFYAFLLVVLHIFPVGFIGNTLRDTQIWVVGADTLSHTVVFLPWMVIGWVHLNASKVYGKKRVRDAVQLFLAGILLAVIAEGIQYFFPYRSFSFMDLAFSMAGVVLGGVVFFIKPKGYS